MVKKNKKSRSFKYIPNRGDLVWILFDPVVGHEQGGYRPAIVISPYENNSVTGMTVVCPITSKIKNYIFEVPVASSVVSGVVLVDQLRSVDISKRKIKFIEKAGNETISKTLGKMLLLISN